jgi:phosphoglycerate dehydrogenase-like enzyme
MTRVAVTSHIFRILPELRKELLAEYPDSRFHEGSLRMTEDELIAFLGDAEAALIGLHRITDKVLSACPDLKVVAACSAGLDHIDPAAMRRHGVALGWRAGVNKVSVAELTISMMISLLRRVHRYNLDLREGRWPPDRMGLHLRGRTVGIHGCGNIGKELVKLLQPFGVNILACDRRDFPEFYREYGVTPVSAEELRGSSEILTIHLPRNSSTIGLYDDATLDQIRDGAMLVNTSRGGIVDEDALRPRLADGRIAGAAFDVFAVEPPTDLTFAHMPNVLATPHIGGSAREAWEAMARGGILGVADHAVPEPGVYPFD